MSETKFIYDASGTVIKEMVVHDAETFTAVSHHAVDPYLDYAKAKREEATDRTSNYRQIAHIPPFVVERAFREGWAHDKAAWAKWFNDDQNKGFRTNDKINRISGREGL